MLSLLYLKAMICLLAIVFVLSVAAHNTSLEENVHLPLLSVWSAWSVCSTSCGYGEQTRTRACPRRSRNCTASYEETRSCMTQFCPSYLSWPRFHFFGTIHTDVPTLNNQRCNYDNKRFTISTAAQRKQLTWDPDGTGHIYLTGMKITALCTAPEICTTSDAINNAGFRGHAVMVDIDTDWQHSPQIWGMSISVEKIFHAKFTRSVCRKLRNRIPGLSADYSKSVAYKSKLTNITWNNEKYKNLFNNATELSMSFVIDLFDTPLQIKGRISGTVGLTSADDPRQTVATRVMRATGVFSGAGIAPLFVYYDLKYISLDLSNAIKAYSTKRFMTIDSMDLALLISSNIYCRYFWTHQHCGTNYNPRNMIYHRLTQDGVLSKKLNTDSEDWYKVYGGVLDINLKHLDNKTLNLMRRNRLAIVHPDSNDPKTLTAVLLESKFGIQSGVTETSVHKLYPGESGKLDVFVSSFGKPVEGIQVDIDSFTRLVHPDCAFFCNKTLGWPKDALSIEASRLPPLTDPFGIIGYTVKGVRGPGSPRGCGLDGQLYPLQVLVKYKSGSKIYVFEEGASLDVKPPHIDITSLQMVTSVYDKVEDIQCPTWQDVKDIFKMYYNLYPVMWKNNIIDLHSYDDIKRRSRMLKAAMFEFDIESPRYMPVSRDLSYGKRKLIWNWIKCGMKKENEMQQSQDECQCKDFDRQLKFIKSDLENAIFVEFATIPPYFTAWLSIKDQEGRNKEVAHILKTIFRDEMRHMSLASNILVAVGGKTKISLNQPIYPCALSYGSFYGLEKAQIISLGRISIGRISDVFCIIERPVNDKGKEELSKLATLWKMLKGLKDFSNQSQTVLFENILKDFTSSNTSRKPNGQDGYEGSADKSATNHTDVWKSIQRFAKKELKIVTNLELHTVNAFYTRIALRLAYLESCAQLKQVNITRNESLTNSNQSDMPTIFIGKQTLQLNQSHWFQRSSDSLEVDCELVDITRTMGDFPPPGQTSENDNKTNIHITKEDITYCRKREDTFRISNLIFPVTDLASALQAVIEIVYQGEGGPRCSPFEDLNEENSNTLSHYYRFQEIVHGRRLVRVRQDLVKPSDDCVKFSEWCKQFRNEWAFCYLGEPLTLFEDGIWPILSDPGQYTYVPGSLAYILDRQFSTVYTSMLHCLDKVFEGNPDHMKFCMTQMYDLTIIGRKLVATNVEHRNGSIGDQVPTAEHATPSFAYLRHLA